MPSPCGVNAVCVEKNGVGLCSCQGKFIGNAYVSCRPECVLNTDCSQNEACKNNICYNPCIDTCGKNTECHVINHSPTCFCQPKTTGNPQIACSPLHDNPSKPLILFYD